MADLNKNKENQEETLQEQLKDAIDCSDIVAFEDAIKAGADISGTLTERDISVIQYAKEFHDASPSKEREEIVNFIILKLAERLLKAQKGNPSLHDLKKPIMKSDGHKLFEARNPIANNDFDEEDVKNVTLH